MPKQKNRKEILLHSNQSYLTFQFRQTKLSYLNSVFFFVEKLPTFWTILNIIRDLRIVECSGAYLNQKKYQILTYLAESLWTLQRTNIRKWFNILSLNSHYLIFFKPVVFMAFILTSTALMKEYFPCANKFQYIKINYKILKLLRLSIILKLTSKADSKCFRNWLENPKYLLRYSNLW